MANDLPSSSTNGNLDSATTAKTYQLLRAGSNRRVLDDVSDDARTLLSKSQRARTTTMRGGLGNATKGDDDGSIVGEEVFDFNDIVVNSTSYRRALHSFNIKTRNRNDAVVEAAKHYPPNNSTSNSAESGEQTITAKREEIEKAIHVNVRDILEVRTEDCLKPLASLSSAMCENGHCNSQVL
jgi:hypothetical protein